MKPRRLATILALALPGFLYGVYRFSVGVLVPGLESVYSVGDASAGAVVSISVGLVGLGVIVSGYLAQRYGDLKIILVGFLLFALSMGAITLASGLLFFSLLFLLASFGSGLMITPSYGLAASVFPERKGLAASFVSASYNFAGFVGPALTGYLLTYYGWDAPFFGFAAVGLVFFAVFLAVLGSGVRSSSTGALSTFVELMRNRVILVIAVGAFLGDFGFLTYLTWTPKFLLSSFGAATGNATTIDTFFGIGLGLGGLGTLAGGSLFDKIGGRKSATLSGVLPAAAMVGVYVANSFTLAILFVLLTGMLANIFWALTTAMCQVNVPGERRTAATSLVQTSGFVGAFLGPGIAGAAGGPVSGVLILTAAVPYILLAVFVSSVYRDPKRTAPPRT
jgi:DHA1 family inner membrane transport protein